MYLGMLIDEVRGKGIILIFYYMGMKLANMYNSFKREHLEEAIDSITY